MKKVVIKICVMFLPCANIIAQIDLKAEFETFIINFDMCQYPYYASWENNKFSECEQKHGGYISEQHDGLFVSGQGLKPFAWICDLDNFLGYVALEQLPATDSVYLLIFAINMERQGCGEGLLLATYSKYTFQLQDTLTIYSFGSYKPQYVNGQRILQSALISSFLTEDSIQIQRTENFFFQGSKGIRD